jgi:NADPH-dependent glutamate synthase beta subunit-like oxidoreductase/Pyruvate/2-oxoacid:ferredoxin oxidoreductase delta subunit
MSDRAITIKDIEPIAPFSRGTTEIFLTGHWSSRKPAWVEKTSPCRGGCPIGNDIARAFHQASLGNYDEALRIFRQDNPLPGVCGRVCYHPCESVCNRKDFDEAINVRGFERFLADHGKVDIAREIPVQLKKEKVAVIGSGPAGLSAAYHLARLGYGVTIFEALPEPGGMLRYGIPAYRLPREVLGTEIGYIRQLGVEIRTGVRVGKEISLAGIRKEYQAVFIAGGAHGGMRLGVEGEDLPGVTEGVGYLRDVALGKPVSPGKHVAVIGGGNTAVDCARTAKRTGGEEITIVYRRSRAEMPAIAEDVEAVEGEGIKVLLLAAPKRLISENGRLTGLECIRMELGAPDAGGRPRPVPVAGSEFILPVDTVIAAVGQVPETGFTTGIGVSLGEGGVIRISPDTAATNVEGVFAGGDGAGTKAFVADAIASGKTGALAIACYLGGKDVNMELQAHRVGTQPSFAFQRVLEPDAYNVNLKEVVTFDQVNTLCFPHGERNRNPEILTPEESVKGFGEVTGGLDPARMPVEIYRCFKCGTCTHCDLCFLLCPDISIVKSGKNGFTVKKDYCKGCSICAATCPRHVIEIGAVK